MFSILTKLNFKKNIIHVTMILGNYEIYVVKFYIFHWDELYCQFKHFTFTTTIHKYARMGKKIKMTEQFHFKKISMNELVTSIKFVNRKLCISMTTFN